MNLKKLFTVTAAALVLTLSNGSIAGAYALENNAKGSQVELREATISNLDFAPNITEEQISSLSDQMLFELSQNGGEIVSIQSTESDLNNGDPNMVTPFTMPTTDFELTVVAQRTTLGNDNRDAFIFTAEGNWKETPFFEFTDVIALSWSDEFTLFSHSAYIYEGCDPICYDYTRTTLNTIKPEEGVAYDVDLQTGHNDEAVFLKATVYKLPNSTGSANVVAEYGHVELTARDITVNFAAGKGGAEIGMSVGFGANLEKAVPAFDDFTY